MTRLPSCRSNLAKISHSALELRGIFITPGSGQRIQIVKALGLMVS